MAFYIVSKGHLQTYDFPYLRGPIPVRLEATLIHGRPHQSSPVSENRDVYAYELMTRQVVSLSPAATVEAARILMHEKRIHHIPLVIDHKLTGLISYRDIVRLPDQKSRVADHMSTLVLCASDSTPLRHLVEVFYRENINALPLVDEDFRLSGIITHRDILRWILEAKAYSTPSA